MRGLGWCSQNAGQEMIFQALDMNSKRLPDWTDAIKEILGILPEDSDDSDDDDA